MGDTPSSMKLDFSSSPTVAKFFKSKAFVRGLLGPVGSGKSYACCAEIWRRAVEQKPSPRDGIKYTRFAIVRNTHPMLRTTTLKTWQELMPENIWGNVKYAPPITHHIKLPPRGDAAGIDCEVIFLALDDPKDVRKLLSLELTGAWVNECRELPKAVIDGLTHRVGRFPTQADGGPTWHGVIMDTNPCDNDHWYYLTAHDKDRPKGKYAWDFFQQPGGVTEVPMEQVPDEMPEAQGYLYAASRWWKTNPKAENLVNLPTGYYEQLLGGKNLDWIRCYAEGKYTYVQEGKAVWPEYQDSLMASDLEPQPGIPVQVGLDFGLTPAAVFAQRMPNGTWHILHELVTFDMGLNRFVNMLKEEMGIYFPKYQFMIWGDPAGQQRDQIYETTAFDHMRSMDLHARPTATNDFKVRREALAIPMSRLIDGKPGLLVNKSCTRLRKSLGGGYHFKRVSMGAGQERYRDTPNKNEHSHIGDAAGYCLLGGGEHKDMITRKGNPMIRQPNAKVLDFDVFD
jgi:hypothetical protein